MSQSVLSDDDINHFIRDGYVVVKNCFRANRRLPFVNAHGSVWGTIGMINPPGRFGGIIYRESTLSLFLTSRPKHGTP
jgi:hypothetical protein